MENIDPKNAELIHGVKHRMADTSFWGRNMPPYQVQMEEKSFLSICTWWRSLLKPDSQHLFSLLLWVSSVTLCRSTDWEVPFPGHFGDALQRLHGKLTASLCSEFVQTSLWPCGFLQETPKAALGKQHDSGHLLRRRGDNSKGKVLFYCSFKRARNWPDNDTPEMHILEPFREQELTPLVSFSRVDKLRADDSQAM